MIVRPGGKMKLCHTLAGFKADESSKGDFPSDCKLTHELRTEQPRGGQSSYTFNARSRLLR